LTRSIYYTATTLDGYIADEHDSLAWLFEQHTDQGGPAGYDEFIAGIGAMVMGATTYAWIGEHMGATGEGWMYDIPCWVFSHREHPSLGEDIRFVSGAVGDHHAAIVASAGDRDVWVVGGGDLAGQLADLGLLDRLVLSVAPVTLGAGRPLFPRQHDLKLAEVARNGDFVVATYDVVGPRSASTRSADGPSDETAQNSS
jgi:dihydrofolate reductase